MYYYIIYRPLTKTRKGRAPGRLGVLYKGEVPQGLSLVKPGIIPRYELG